jgi:Haloacid dehalogenase-like hydrolase
LPGSRRTGAMNGEPINSTPFSIPRIGPVEVAVGRRIWNSLGVEILWRFGLPARSIRAAAFQMPKAAIFDVDGALADSVDLHATAWQEALVKFGHEVTFEQARGQFGKGGDQLIPVFLSEAEQADHGEAMEEWRGIMFTARPKV